MEYKVGPFVVNLDNWNGEEWTDASCECEYFGTQAMTPRDRECKHIRQARLYASLNRNIVKLDDKPKQ